MTLPTGTRLGTYEVTAAIGAGGMGEVYRAKDANLNRDVAIKVLPAAMAADPERLARFKREAQVLGSLNHPNIAHVYGFESATLEDGTKAHFLAMEMVEGEDLSERLKRGAIPVDEAIAISKQIAFGLEEAHERGIILAARGESLPAFDERCIPPGFFAQKPEYAQYSGSSTHRHPGASLVSVLRRTFTTDC